MRTTFVETLCVEAEHDPRVWLVTGDLGYSVLERFANRFPDRYLNAGVAEQNMIGVASGLAMAGKCVFCYSIANFPTLRCLEQVRNDVCYHELDVKIVAVGCGLAYGGHGYTHHGVEDLAVMAALPAMTVLAPGDPAETRWATRTLVQRRGPAYLRLGKAGEPAVHASEPTIEFGKAVLVYDGGDATVITTGGMLDLAVKAAKALEERGLAIRVLSLPTFRPLDVDRVVAEARRGPVLTLEEHGPGGLGTVVGEAIARAGVATRFVPMRLGDTPTTCAGSQAYLCGQHGLSLEGVADAVARLCRESG